MTRNRSLAVTLTALALLCAGLTFAQAEPSGSMPEVGSGLDPSQVVGPPHGQPLEGEKLYRLTEEVAGTMRCPVCQGLSVADSQTATAVAMKAEVRQMLEVGYSRDQVLDYFEESYGEFIRLAPKAEGFNLFVWIAPIAALLLGLVLVAQRMRRREAGPAAAGDQPLVDPQLQAYIERVRREVAS